MLVDIIAKYKNPMLRALLATSAKASAFATHDISEERFIDSDTALLYTCIHIRDEALPESSLLG